MSPKPLRKMPTTKSTMTASATRPSPPCGSISRRWSRTRSKSQMRTEGARSQKPGASRGVYLLARGYWLLASMLIIGCRKPGVPEAIWCDTGTGPDQVVYPRAIAYKKTDDTFFIVDRVARIQHLDRNGNYLNE